jgi:hypothetical protein
MLFSRRGDWYYQDWDDRLSCFPAIRSLMAQKMMTSEWWVPLWKLIVKVNYCRQLKRHVPYMWRYMVHLNKFIVNVPCESSWSSTLNWPTLLQIFDWMSATTEDRISLAHSFWVALVLKPSSPGSPGTERILRAPMQDIQFNSRIFGGSSYDFLYHHLRTGSI